MISISTFLKNLGFGLVVTGVQDHFFEESLNPYNLAAMAIGTFGWMTGVYLEVRSNHSLPEQKKLDTSTKMMTQSLSHAAGVGPVNGLTHLIKRVDTNSANLGNVVCGIVLPIAIIELEAEAKTPIPPLKWEKLRLLILLTGDVLASFGMKKIMNGQLPDLESGLLLPVGLALSIGEWVYGRKHDDGLMLPKALLRRCFKLSSILGLVFSAYDLIVKNNDKYTMADDVYQTLVAALLFAVVVKLARMSRVTNTLPMFQTVQPANVVDVSASDAAYKQLNQI